MNSREKMLIGMNEIITSLNNEEAAEIWLSLGVPDGADDEEILDIANSEDFFYMASLFLDIMKRKSAYSDGIYVDGRVITNESRKEE